MSENHSRKNTMVIAAVVIVAVMAVAAFQSVHGELIGTAWALVPPVIAIALALITKEAYSSLFIGIVLGAMMYSGFSFSGTLTAVVNDGIIASVSGSAGIFIFLIILGIIVALVNRIGGSQAFGRWAAVHVKSKMGACIATFLLGVLIFIDDYFNCLTVGSVMRPLTDSKNISRVKLAYLIDATAAPICMIAPISSWAAAVSGCVDTTSYSGIELFMKAIPFNFYSLMTLVFIITISVMGFDYGKMAKFELAAMQGDLAELDDDAENQQDEKFNENGRVIDLLLPVGILVVACVAGLLYVGGFFGTDIGGGTDCAGDFIAAFGNTDAFVGLPWGGIIALVIIFAYLLIRHLISFQDAMDCIPKGFIAMVPAVLILTFATSLKNMTNALEAREYVYDVMQSAADGLFAFLPAIIFLVGCLLAFATGTSWGTFGILIPIVTSMFPEDSPLFFVGISACLAGAVCGDHCSPISDTTIMASAGARFNHVDHVSTQLPYAITVAAVSFVSFIIAGFVPNPWICLPVSTALTIGTVFGIRAFTRKRAA